MSRDDLTARIAALAAAPVLLVASDYDGTLAPIVDEPARAFPLVEAITALSELAAMPATHVAVISGRSLHDLAGLSRLPNEVVLVGSHGAERDAGFSEDLAPEIRARLAAVRAELDAIAERTPGAWVETKPASAALHVRRAEPDAAAAALREARDGPGRGPGVTVREGKRVVELLVVAAHKGDALRALREERGAGAVLFVGDDETDEDAFAVLGPDDVGVKVGDGETAAGYRVDAPADAAALLAALSERRRQWLAAGHA